MTSFIQKNWLSLVQKALCSVVVFALLFTQLVSASVLAAVIDPADPPNNPEVVYDLIAVVVDKEIDQNSTSYEGLRNAYVNELGSFSAQVNGGSVTMSGSTLSERIVRYSEDLRASNNLTDVKILFYDKEEDSVQDLALALENLYINGESTHNNRLVGAVFVGDIPMPVVNKEGNKIMSLFPYTDFEDKTYIYNELEESFEENGANIFPKPEIWHGIINAPNEELAEYFDKNHLYYSGVPEFANFDKKLFFADLKNEEEGMNEEIFKKYNEYLDVAEDLIYMRYNKFWANKITGETMEDMTFNPDNPDGVAFQQEMENLDLRDTLPDIYAKNIIDQAYPSYYEIFGNYISKINDFVSNTGRYTPSDADNMPILITIKDEYNKYYLKAVNDAIEKAVNKAVERIEDPIPLLSKTQMTGKFDDALSTTFGVAVSGGLTPVNLPLGWKMDEIYFRYHYYNEILNDLYVNGIASEDITNAKQCSVYLGSTRDDLDGDISVLTSSIRSNNKSTSAPTHTAGVNTRTLTAEEAFSLTGGEVSNGAVVESNEYGMPAFVLNDLFGDGDNYLSPLQKALKEGDVITKVNGEDIDPMNPFDLAITNSFDWVKALMEISNSDSYTDDEKDTILEEYKYDVAMPNSDSITGADAKQAAGIIEIQYYRGSQKFTKNFSFTVHEDSYTTRDDPEGNPEMIVLLSPSQADNFNSQADFDGNNWSDGAIFSLYNTEEQGFDGEGYDASAGCNANSTEYFDDSTNTTVLNKDRCYGFLAAMPVLDPAGSVNVRTAIEPAHPYLYNPPANTEWEDIDEVIYDACYFGMPTVKSLGDDGNPYPFPLDPSEKNIMDYSIDQDYYGDLLDKAGEFINTNDASDPEKPTSKSDDWKNLDDLSAGDVTLNNYLLSDKVTLKHFSDRYGLFDGIDNDGDGIRDHYWEDNDADGIYETKVYDTQEADAQYALDPENLGEIARKMLSHSSTFVLPSSLSPFSNDISLTVAVEQKKEISSMILHNEPTPHTIMEQLKSMTTMDLPIDNPRYVAFMSDPVPFPQYPGVTEDPHYFPGDIQKIIYPNLFDYTNFAELEVAMDQLAWDMTMIPGSYKIDNGASYLDCRIPADNLVKCKEIHDLILEEYLDPVVGFSGDMDNPNDFEIEEASVKKVYDALSWNGMNIDQKHEYVLEKYLNDGVNSYAADATVFPAPTGYTVGNGYEAAYLVLDGDGDNFDMGFNKDTPEEVDEDFDPLESIVTEEDSGDDYDAEPTVEEQEEAGFEFVWLDQFLKETVEFITFFGQPPDFKDCCGLSEELSEAREAEEGGSEEPGVDTATYKSALLSDQPLDHLELSVSDSTINAGSLDGLTVYVAAYDANDKLIGPLSDNPLISLEVLQNDESPLLSDGGYNEKALTNGRTEFDLSTTGEIGNVVISADSSNGISSNSVPVKITTRDVVFSSFTYYEPDVEALNEYLDELGILEDEEVPFFEEEVEEEPWEDESLNFVLDIVEEFSDEEEEEEVVEEVVEELADDDDSEEEDEEIVIDSETEAELKDILSEYSVEPEVVEEVVEEEVIEEVADDILDEEEPDIVILESELVEETTLTSTPVEEEEVIEDESGGGWEEYYLDINYYLKFIDDPEAHKPRLLVEAFSDRMISYIPDEENPFVEAEGNEDSQYAVEIDDEMIADGESLMMLSVSIYDEVGDLVSESKQVRFSIIDSLIPDIVTFENGDTATSVNGEAVVYLRAGTKIGAFKIQAEVLDSNGSVDTNYPLEDHQLYLVAGPPACLSIETDSCIIPSGADPCSPNLEACMLVANNQFKSELKISLRDKFGNLANNSFSQVGLFIDEKAYVDPSKDANNQILGTQIGTLEGEAYVDLFAEDETGNVNLIALLMDYELEEEFYEVGDDFDEIDFTKYVGNSRDFELLEDVSLSISLDKTSIAVGGEEMGIETKLISGGQVVDNYNGPIKFTVLNDKLGRFAKTPPSKMVNGVLLGSNVEFVSSEAAGTVEILVEIPGAVSDTITFVSEPLAPETIELSASQDRIYSDGIEDVILEARLLDEYGNLVNTNTGTGIAVNFSTSAATAGYIDFPTGQSAISLKGVASLRITGGDISGDANIVAQSAQIAETASISLKIMKHFSPAKINDFLPRALYISLLGGGFGKIATDKNMSELLLYSKKIEDGAPAWSQVQAISSLSASPTSYKRLIGVDPYGKIEVMEESVAPKVVLATDSFPYQKVVFSEGVDDEELATVVMVPDPNTSVELLEGEIEEVDEIGVYVKNVSTVDPDLEFVEEDDGIYINKNGETKVKIDNFGRIFINDDLYSLNLGEGANLTFAVSSIVEDIAYVTFVQDFGKNVDFKDYGESLGAFPGVYMVLNNPSSKYSSMESYTRADTGQPRGVYLVDVEEEVDAAQSAQYYESFGYGFTGQNKHMLFYAAGNSVGESNIPYGSEITVVYGDPNIRLKIGGIVGLISSMTGFTKTLEKSIYTGDEQIQRMIDFDYNGDGMDDLLLIYDDGRIRLLEHEISNRHFRDKGYVLKAYGGAISAVGIDVNNDGYDDLILGTEEPCAEGEQPISLYTNMNGHFERETLNLNVEGGIVELKSDDMNADGCFDLVASDSAGNIRVFYNTNDGDTCTGLETTHGYGKNFGYSIDSNENLSENLFINYSGMPSSANESITFILSSEDPPATEEDGAAYASDIADLYNTLPGNDVITDLELPPLTYPKEFTFIHIYDDPSFGVSTAKQAIDANGGTIAKGDKINYVIYLENDGASVSDMMVSDFTPVNMTLDLESLECLDSDCPDELEWEETSMSMRSHVIKNISVPSGGTRTIKYSMTLNEVPEIAFDVGDFDGQNYSDMQVRPSFNPDGSLTYLYSKANLSASGYNDYDMDVVAAEGLDRGDDLPIDLEGLSNVDPNDPKIPPDLKQKMNSMAYPFDSDGDGCADSWANPFASEPSAAEAIANSVENAMSALRCSGGCLPIPYNYAFFAMDDTTPGLPVFSAGHTWPGGIGSFIPTTLPSTFRFYLSPTLTLGLGTAVCTGDSSSGTAPCFVFAVPLAEMTGLCDAIEGPINDAIATATSVTSTPDIGMATVVSDGSGGAGTGATSGNFAYSNTKSPVSAAGSANIKVPGFPSVITNWIDKQSSEIYNKLLDFPTFYFLYPDFKTMIPDSKTFEANFSQIQNLYDFLRVINSIPLVQVEGKEVLIKIPALSQSELLKWKKQAEAWIKYEESEIKRFVDHYQCDTTNDETRKSLCDKFAVNMKDLLQAVRGLMGKIDQIANLPRDVLNWKSLESKYATQIICWLDAIMEFTGGYVRKQSKIIKSWIKASEDAIKTFKDWKVILDLAAEYQKSCDQCKSDRFSKLGVLMQLFAAIPEPPVIPLPKWPDIVADFSQLKTGVKVIWPDLKFQPESVRLPNLPYFTFPTEFAPDLLLELPSFDIPSWLSEFPDFVMPDLPDLPALQVPKLPDLPRPPRIPKLPKPVVSLGQNLKSIFKILCLLKKGLIPVPEAKLATEIQTLTQSSVKATLPIIGKLGFQTPPIKYDFIEQIRITAKLDIGLDLSTIYLVVKAGAGVMNQAVKTIIDGINEFLSFDLQGPINEASQKAEQALSESVKAGVERAMEEVEEANEAATEEITFEDFPAFEEINSQFEEMNRVLDDYIAVMEMEELPDTYYLTATTEYLDPSDPLLNRTLAEIEIDIQNQDLPDTPEIQRLAAIRDSLIDYTKNLNSTNDSLNQTINDYDAFTKILVDNDDDISGKLASLSPVIDDREVGVEEVEFKMFDNALIAADIDAVEEVTDLLDGGEPAVAPEGFFVAVGTQSESVLTYTQELGNGVQTIFSDVDADEDHDIIFSMGGDVYFKENYSSTNPLSVYLAEGDVILTTTDSAVSDFVPVGGASVQGVSSPYENNNKADVSWTEVEGAVSYEILIKRSLLHDDEDATYTYTIDAPASSYSIDEIENGNYYAVVYAINADGERSLASNNTIVAPQICADQDAPFPAVTQTEFRLSIFEELEIDASGSFDTSGEVTEYFLEGDGQIYWSDQNTAIDSDGDGIVWNDMNNPVFKIGPYDDKTDVGLHEFVLNVADQSGHTSSQDLSVEVFVPEISLDDTISRSYTATGEVDPEVRFLPFSILRSRYIFRSVDDELVAFPRVDKIETPSIETSGKYLTNADGSYDVSDFNLEDMILVENSAGEIIAEIHPETGNIGAVESGYESEVQEAVPPVSPTGVDILNSNGSKLASVHLIADPNQDVNIWEDVYFDAENYQEYDGVNVSDVELSDDLQFQGISAKDPYYPGGAAFINIDEDKHLLFIDPAGNILVVDERITLELKENDHYVDPLVIDVLFDGDKVAEIYISVYLEDMLIVGPNDVPYQTPRAPSASIFYAYGDLASLAPEFLPEELVRRDEFVKVLLDLLCIIPRPEAYEAYSGNEGESGGGFYDVVWNSAQLPQYYEHIKEADLLGLIYGYTGETDPATGLHPFKPEETITRAEATNIILEALEFEGVLNLDGLGIGSPWYVPIIEAGEDMTPYINEGFNLKSNFIITSEEALEPNKMMTHADLKIMVDRVLELYACYELDADADGMSDFCELKYDIEEPYEDEDGDDFLNTNECFYLTDPTNPDTDGGGMSDGTEFNLFNTNPLNPEDDPEDSDGDGCSDLSELLVYNTDPTDPDTNDDGVNDCVFDGEYSEAEPGIYIVPANCNTCPCISTLLHKADLIPGDIIFTVISTYEEDYIFSKSNEVTIQ